MQPIDQQIDNAEGLGIRQLTQMQQTNPELVVGVALENLKQELMASERQRQMDMMKDSTPSDVIGQTYSEVAGMMGGGDQAPMGQAPMGQAPMGQAPMGLPGLPADNMAMQTAAQGGIVGYEEGGLLDGVANYISQYKAYMAGLASASTEEEKQERRRLWKIAQSNFDPTIVTAAHQKMSTEGQSGMDGMAGGGIVSLQEGGFLEVGDQTADGVEIVRMIFSSTGEKIPVTSAEYQTYLETNVLPSNRNAAASESGTNLKSLIDSVTSTFSLPTETSLNIDEQYAANPDAFTADGITPVGGPGANFIERAKAVDEATGDVIFGDDGFYQQQKDIAANPEYDTMGKQVGAQGVAAGEAIIQGILKSLGMGVNLGIGGLESLVEVGEGGATELNVQSEELVAAAVEKAENQFTLDIAPLVSQLQELNSNADVFSTEEGKAKIAALELTIKGKTAEYNKSIEGLRQTPSLTETIKSVPQGILGAMQNYQNDPGSTMVGGILEGVTNTYKEQQIKKQNATNRAELAANAEAAAPRSDEEMLTEIAGAIKDGSGSPIGSSAEGNTDNGEGGEGGRNWLDKTLDVMQLLGQAGGASKGYEFTKINEAQAAKRALADANEFDMEKQQALLDQRTDERSMLLEQQRLIARAEAMTDARADIMMKIQGSSERRKVKEKIENDNDGGYFGFADQDAIDAALAEYDAEKFQEALTEIGEFFDEGSMQVRKGPSVGTAGSQFKILESN